MNLRASILVACVWWTVAAAALRGDAGQTFRATADAVEVDVLATRGGRPVAGLTAADFELKDNGIVQQIEAIALEDVPVTVSLVLDVSESVEGQPLQHLRSAIEAAAAALSPRDQLALFTFSHRVGLAAAATTDLARVRSAAGVVQAEGATALYDATFAAIVMRERIRGRVVMLVFSDGDDTASWIDPRNAIQAAHRSDVVVYGVTLENRSGRDRPGAVARTRDEQQWFLKEPALFGRQYLSLLAGETGGAVLVAERSDSLRDTFVRVVNEFKSRYVLTYTPGGVAPGGWHALDVRLKKVRADVTARRGYLRGK
jgi:VWFA-related protein